MSHYKPYPAYKDSGVEWIGRVPEHWKVVALKRLGTLKGGNGFPPDMQGRSGNELPFYKVGDLGRSTDGVTIGETEHSISRGDASSLGATVFPPGALAWAKIGAALSLNRRRILQSPSCLDNNMTGFTPDLSKASTTFCFRLLSSVDFSVHAKPGAIPSFSEGDQSELRVACPPADEQSAITTVLDLETARIDALIAKKTRFIELLKEKRQALITHAVTKGLDLAVAMKNSGVEWIGKVPEHWELSKLAYITREAGGKTPDTKNLAYWGGGVPWVSPKDMKQPEIFGAIDKITDAAVIECGMFVLQPGTVLVVVRGMILAHSFPVAELKVPATINQDMKALEPDKRITPAYLRLMLETAKNYVVSVLVAEAAHGTRVLRTDVWRQLPALLPPVGEQDSILGELDRITAAHDKLIQKVERSVTLLKERRSALITAAVTGQIDLREYA